MRQFPAGRKKKKKKKKKSRFPGVDRVPARFARIDLREDRLCSLAHAPHDKRAVLSFHPLAHADSLGLALERHATVEHPEHCCAFELNR